MSVAVISDGPWRMLRVSWVLWSVGFFFFLSVLLEGLVSRNVHLFLFGSMKGLTLAVVLLPSSRLVQLPLCLKETFRQWFCGLCMSCACLLKTTLPFKFSKHTDFSKSSGLLPLNSFLDMFCWKMVTSLYVDFCRSIKLKYLCSTENYLSCGMIKKWAINYGAESTILQLKKKKRWKMPFKPKKKKSVKDLDNCCF